MAIPLNFSLFLMKNQSMETVCSSLERGKTKTKRYYLNVDTDERIIMHWRKYLCSAQEIKIWPKLPIYGLLSICVILYMENPEARSFQFQSRRAYIWPA